jgi:hypothetical protein
MVCGLIYVGWLALHAGCNKASDFMERATACRLERIEHPVYGPQLRIVNAAGDVVVAAGEVASGWTANTKVSGTACRWSRNGKGEWLVRYKGMDFWLSEGEMMEAITAGHGEMAFPTRE